MLIDSITWYAAVRVDISKRLLLHVFRFEGFEFVWNTQLFENDDDLETCN
jgi:hypothetical protein